MRYDDEGFCYPEVDHDKCIECSLCEKVCPCLTVEDEKEPLNVYAAIANNEDLRRESSSGGIFSLLANKIIERGGIVVGAAFTYDWQVRMICISDLRELWRLRGSKYVQADTANTFSEAEKYLKEGREVLYSGTPCQIKALKLFLRKDFDNLITVDVACHGVPSPGVWNKYLEDVSKNARKAIDDGSVDFSSLNEMSLIKNIRFREKSEGWRKYRIVFYIGEPNSDRNIELSSICCKNPYFNAFNYSLIIRPSCTECTAKLGKSNSDVTIADFWGIEKVAPHMDDNKGTSLILINTLKGKVLFDQIDANIVQCTYEDALRYNAGLRENTRYHSKRQKFFKKYKNKKSITMYMQSLLIESFTQRAIGYLKRKIRV
ncbi:MAG: Coenzyme F420 hydrogenase/dehydrogenase, beta subunit C-terminal domain [Bacteroidales bacterium]